MTGSTSRSQKPFRASENEQASIRALKNWLFAAPPENALDDQIVRERLASAIATLSETQERQEPRQSRACRRLIHRPSSGKYSPIANA